MCAFDPILCAAPMIPPVLNQVAAYTAPIVEGARSMLKLVLVAAVGLTVSACDMAKPTPDSITTMEVVSRTNSARKFVVILRDPATGEKFRVRPGTGKRKRCTNGPKLKVGQRLAVRVNNWIYDDGRRTYGVDRYALRAKVC